ncbi:MAG: hypothetical protein HY812_05945, partial [Planctomycetes bacterium]|nr:hypothetical protein [Planctomycetota bacterium]
MPLLLERAAGSLGVGMPEARGRGLAALGISLGAASQVAQLLLMRELLAVFGANELAIACALGAWLLGTALGAAAGARLRQGLLARAAEGALAVACGVLLPAALALLRVLREAGTAQGGPSDLLVAALFFAAPLAALFGARFALLAAAGADPPRLFALEAAGFALAGLLLAPGLLLACEPFALACGAAALDLALHAWAARPGERSWPALGAGLFVLGVLFASRLERLSEERYYAAVAPGTRPVAHGLSAFGALSARERGGETSIYRGGRLLVSLGTDEAERALAACTFLRAARAARVFVAGAIGPAAVDEWLRLGAEQVVLAPDDARTFAFLCERLDEKGRALFRDARVHVIPGDARDLLRRAREPFDVIVVHAGEPDTLAAGRSYTVEFFAMAKQALAEGGVIAVGPLYASGAGSIAELIARNRLLAAAALEALDDVAFTASPCYLVAARGAAPAVPAQREVRASARARALDIDSIDLSALLDPQVVERLRGEALSGAPYDPLAAEPQERDLPPPASDARPSAVFASLALEGRLVDDPLAAALSRLLRADARAVFLAALFALGSLLLACGASARGRALALPFAAGLFGASAQVLLLLAFQLRSGRLIPNLGLLTVGTFMMIAA